MDKLLAALLLGILVVSLIIVVFSKDIAPASVEAGTNVKLKIEDAFID